MLRLGCHLTVSKGYAYMGKRILELGGNTFQYFSRNPRGGSVKALDFTDVQDLKDIIDRNDLGSIVAHAPYTLNLSGNREETFDFAKRVVREDLERLEALPGQWYNLHPGSHTGKGIQWGMERILKGLEASVFKECTSTLLFEMMAGKGSEIGSNFEEIQFLLENVPYKEKFGVCLDTCHLHESGYNVVHDLEGVLDQIEGSFGLEKVKVIHLNDSKNLRGARKDRHEKLGQGNIGLGALMGIVANDRLRDKTFILETPNEEEGYGIEIQLIKEILKNEQKR